MWSPEVWHEREDAVGPICWSLRRRSYGGGYVNLAAVAALDEGTRALMGRDLLGGVTGLAAAALGVLIGLGLFAAYSTIVKAAYPDFGIVHYDVTESSMFVLRGLQALSLLFIAVFLIAPAGLAYGLARMLRANPLAAAVTAGFLSATLAFPALVVLSAVNDCLMGHSFPIPGTYCD